MRSPNSQEHSSCTNLLEAGPILKSNVLRTASGSAPVQVDTLVYGEKKGEAVAKLSKRPAVEDASDRKRCWFSRGTGREKFSGAFWRVRVTAAGSRFHLAPDSPRHRAAVPPCRCVDRSRQLPPANRISNEPLSLCASTNQFCNEGSLWRGRKPAPHLRITRFELALTPCFRSPLNGTRRHYGNSKLIASWRNRPLAIKLRTTRV